MASLTGQLVAETYKALLKTIDNDILTASEKQITDGFGGGSNVFIDSQGFLRANKYKVTNGLATQFLKADGSLDSNTYLTGITSSQIITALGYTPVPTTRTLTINGTTYDLSANRSWTVAGTAAVWGNITGTLSNQTDLQTALNAKYNNPTGTISQYIRGDGSLATFPTLPGGLPTGGTAGQILAKIDATDYNTHWIDNFATQTKNEVKLGATLAKGTAVYVSGSTGGSGTNMIVMAASNASEALSSKTFGLLETGGATNDFVKCVTFGLIAGLDTSTAQAGDPVWLGVNGALLFGLANKPVAPANMVYIGVVTRVQSNNGEIFVNVQNGFEIEELHDVLIQSKANNQGLFYESSTGLWKNKSIATVLGYTPQAQLDGTGFVKASGTTISYDNSTYLTTADAASTYQLLTNLSTDLTASATKYPSVNAVIAGLATKLNLTGGTLTGSITATSFVKTGGTSNEYLRADGSVNVITGDIISGSGTAGYIAKFGSSAVIASSNLFESGANIGFGTITLNYGSYGRAFTGAGFGSTSFGFEAVTGSTTNGGLIGGLSLVIAGNDSTRRIGSAIQSYISGATSTHQGADLRFFVKPDNGILLEVVRMTSAGITFNKDLTAANITASSFVKSGGLSTQFLMADGSVSTLSSPVTGSGSAGYIPKWTTAANIGSSIIYEDTSIGIAYTTPNRGGYGRTLSGASFGSASFGFEAVSNTTTNGGLIGGLSFIVNQNDSSRIVGSAIQSNLVGTTATNYGADLRFFAKADGVFTIAEVARMTSAGLRVYGTIVKDGGTSSQYLMADGSVSTLSDVVTGSGTINYLPKWTSASGLSSTSLIYDTGSSIGIGTISISNTAGFQRQLQIEGTYPALTLKNVTGTAGSYSLGAGSAGDFGIWNNTLSQYAIYVPSSNNVIIGTGGDAGYKLDVGGTSIFRGTSIVTSSGGYSAGLVVQNTNTADSNFSVLTLKANTNGYPIVEFKEGDNQKWQVFNDWVNDSLSFYKWVGTPETLLTLRSNGNVGISNTNPYGKFEISSSSQQYQTAPAITFTDTAGDAASNRWMVGNIATTYGAFNIASAPTPSSTTFTSRFTILPNGNVGIGTPTPTAQLSGTFGLSILHSSNAALGLSNGTNSWLNYLAGTTYRIWNNTTSEIMVMHLNGNVTIGGSIIDAGYKLDVNGTGRFNGTIAANAGGGQIQINGGSTISGIFQGTATNNLFIGDWNTATKGLSINVSSGNSIFSSSVTAKTVGDYRQPTLGTATGAGLFITNTSYAGYGLLIGNSYSYGDSWIQVGRVDGTATAYNLLLQQSGGNVGIGTTTPTGTYGKLSVAGGISLINDNNGKLEIGRYSSGAPNSYIKLGSGSNSLNITNNADAVDLFNFLNNGSFGINNSDPVNTAWGSGTTTKQLSIDASAYAVINLQGASRKYSMGVGDNNFYMCYDNSQSRHNITVSGAGNVTINGTADAGYRLDVSGTVRLQGATLIGERSVIYATRLASFTTQTSGNLLIQSQAYSGSGFNTIDFGSSTWSVPLARIGVEITGSGTNMRFGTSSNYGTGITNSALILDYTGGATFASYVYATSFFESSDIRLKTLIDGSAQIAGIENLQAKLYEKNGKIELGYFAQDAEKLMPYAVTKNTDGFLNLSYREVHTAKIARLEQRVAELEKQLNLN